MGMRRWLTVLKAAHCRCFAQYARIRSISQLYVIEHGGCHIQAAFGNEYIGSLALKMSSDGAPIDSSFQVQFFNCANLYA